MVGAPRPTEKAEAGSIGSTGPSNKVKGKVEAMPRKQLPSLFPLRYGSVYCELCHRTINAGDRVGWWKVQTKPGRRPAAYCRECHHENVKRRRALRAA